MIILVAMLIIMTLVSFCVCWTSFYMTIEINELQCKNLELMSKLENQTVLKTELNRFRTYYEDIYKIVLPRDEFVYYDNGSVEKLFRKLRSTYTDWN